MNSQFLHLENLPRSIELKKEGDNAQFVFVDQRLLPDQLSMISTSSWKEVIDAIKTLAVRGAPALGVSGMAALSLWAFENKNREVDDSYIERFEQAAEIIASARPTAVNLRWGTEKALAFGKEIAFIERTAQAVAESLFDFTLDAALEDERVNRAIGENGAALLEPHSKVLTHCNAGSLATCFYGTALGVVYSAAALGKIDRIYADETRPVGQGARLTTWELSQVGVPTTLICDNMAAALMAKGQIDAVIVGADRIAANGDVANKIGTYGVAVLAHAHDIPFYVAAPLSTIDLSTPCGTDIAIEERPVEEVLEKPIKGVNVWNPAFDITPAHLIKAIITEKGVFSPDSLESSL